VFRGLRGDVVWIKIRLPHGGIHKGKSYKANEAVEMKIGNLGSFSWAQLEDVYQDYQGKADRGEALEEVHAPLFSEYAEDWLKLQKHLQRGFKTTKGIIDNHLLKFFADRTLDSIGVSDINKWQSKQLMTYEASTVKRQRNVLHSILNTAYRENIITETPCNRTSPIKINEKPIRYLTGEELVLLLAEAEKQVDWLRDYILFAVHTGLRRGEMRDLVWNHVLTTPQGTFLRFPTGKTQKLRIVHCSKTVGNVLDKLKRGKAENDNRVFQISQTTLIRKWRIAKENTALKDITIQSLRSTNASYAVSSGVDLNTVAKSLGHSDLTMLERHYGALMNTGVIEASAKVEKELEKAMGG
jgi:integrase